MLTATKRETLGDKLGRFGWFCDNMLTKKPYLCVVLSYRACICRNFVLQIGKCKFLTIRMLLYMCDKKGNSLFCRLPDGATNRENAEYCLLFILCFPQNIVYCEAIYP